jgi:hypothetical protein
VTAELVLAKKTRLLLFLIKNIKTKFKIKKKENNM